jgi:alpha-glucuronidase
MGMKQYKIVIRYNHRNNSGRDNFPWAWYVYDENYNDIPNAVRMVASDREKSLYVSKKRAERMARKLKKNYDKSKKFKDQSYLYPRSVSVADTGIIRGDISYG